MNAGGSVEYQFKRIRDVAHTVRESPNGDYSTWFSAHVGRNRTRLHDSTAKLNRMLFCIENGKPGPLYELKCGLQGHVDELSELKSP